MEKIKIKPGRNLGHFPTRLGLKIGFAVFSCSAPLRAEATGALQKSAHLTTSPSPIFLPFLCLFSISHEFFFFLVPVDGRIIPLLCDS
jgi:hypothetical protein